MNKKYIITAHNNPKHLLRLINKLDDQNSSFYIHIDLKSDLTEFSGLISKDNVKFIDDRINCIWGDFSLVIAILNLLKTAVKDDCSSEITKIIFLSGNDYPIKAINELDAYMFENKEYDFLSFQFENKLIPTNHSNYIQRINSYKYNFSSERGDYFLTKGFMQENWKGKRTLIKYLLKRRISLSFFIKTFFKRMEIFKENCKGANWFVFRESTVKILLDYVNSNEEKLHSYYKYTLCADEQFFHTILNEIMKSNEDIKLKPYLHFIDWSRENVQLPVTFTSDDLNLLMSQPKEIFFARKFDDKVDSQILDLIDQKIE